MTLGVGAGQQSRVDGVRVAGAKTDTWWLRRHPRVQALTAGGDRKIQDRINDQISYLDADPAARGDDAGPVPLTGADRARWLRQLDQVALASDGALPFPDNIDHAHRHGVRYIAEPGGSTRSANVAAVCQDRGIALIHTGLRLFRH
ncbi:MULTISPECIES: hypothetical protein [unclassified Frankia]|uniref:hypothetical protein n=1 Tax=unclassified Frankia TaxID=2632575 RepID=UPI002101E0E6|nr:MULTISPECIES: hypothetical protein [unclassified Frankia]